MNRTTAPSWVAPSGRWTPSDGRLMVAAFSASGLSRRAFATKHKVPLHRVAYWLAKESRVSSSVAGGGFAEAQVVSAHPVASVQPWIELELGNGRRLALRGGWDEASIRTWVRALEGL